MVYAERYQPGPDSYAALRFGRDECFAIIKNIIYFSGRAYPR